MHIFVVHVFYCDRHANEFHLTVDGKYFWSKCLAPFEPCSLSSMSHSPRTPRFNVERCGKTDVQLRSFKLMDNIEEWVKGNTSKTKKWIALEIVPNIEEWVEGVTPKRQEVDCFNNTSQRWNVGLKGILPKPKSRLLQKYFPCTVAYWCVSNLPLAKMAQNSPMALTQTPVHLKTL